MVSPSSTLETTVTFDKCPGANQLSYPDGADFMRMLTSHPTVLLPLLIISCLAYAVVAVLSVKLLRNAASIRDEQIRSDLYLCLSTPIVVASISLLGMFVPRSNPAMSTVSLAYVMFSLWRCVSLLFRMYGDAAHMSALMYETNTRLPLHSVPLCCCPCLPSLEPTVDRIETLKYFVLQTPVVRMVLVVVISTIRVEGYCDSTLVTRILSWCGLASTLIAVYSSTILVKMSNEHIARYRIAALFRCTNLTQALYNVLRFVVDQLAMNRALFIDLDFADGSVLQARVQADFWYNALLILILVLIAFALNANIQPGRSALFEIEPTPFASDNKRLPIIASRNGAAPSYEAMSMV